MVLALPGILKHVLENLFAGTATVKNEQLNLKVNFLSLCM
jgi:hypothetical protein